MCASVPEVPVKVTVALPAVADAAAVMVTDWAVPGVSVSDDGCAVTPAGRPVMAMDTLPVNPLTAFALTLTAEPVAPAVRESVVGDTARL